MTMSTKDTIFICDDVDSPNDTNVVVIDVYKSCCRPEILTSGSVVDGRLEHKEHGTLDVYCSKRSSNGSVEFLACIPNKPHPPFDVALLTALSVSLFCIVITITAHVLLRRLGNNYGKALVCFNVSLFLLYMQVIINLCVVDNNQICMSQTQIEVSYFFLFYFILAPFTWMSVISFDIFRKFRNIWRDVSDSHLFIVYSAIAWGLPLLTASLRIAFLGIHSQLEEILLNLAPVSVLLVFNITLFTITSMTIYRSRRETSSILRGADSRSSRQAEMQYSLYIRLFVITGVTWITWVIRWALKKTTLDIPEEYYYFTQMINASQGFFVLVATVCNRDTFRKLRNHVLRVKSYISQTSTRTSQMSLSSQRSTDLHLRPNEGRT